MAMIKRTVSTPPKAETPRPLYGRNDPGSHALAASIQGWSSQGRSLLGIRQRKPLPGGGCLVWKGGGGGTGLLRVVERGLGQGYDTDMRYESTG